MCLDKTTRVFDNHPEFEAWKVVSYRLLSARLYLARTFTGPFSHTLIKRGEWMKAEWEPADKTFVYKGDHGFNVFEKREDAKDWAESQRSVCSLCRIEKVRCRGRTRVGTVKCRSAAVVDEIYFERSYNG